MQGWKLRGEKQDSSSIDKGRYKNTVSGLYLWFHGSGFHLESRKEHAGDSEIKKQGQNEKLEHLLNETPAHASSQAGAVSFVRREH
jgi:hypothetical protein